MFFMTPPPPPPKKPIMTIWIHGTRSSSFLPTKQAKRFEEFMGTGVIGLHHIKSLKEDSKFSRVAKSICKADSNMFPPEHFYLFGWSGILHPAARKEAAKNLYDELLKECKSVEDTYNQKPLINLITHSHGGNVALYLKEFIKDEELYIENLILLACPVQQETACYIDSPVFRHKLSIHSHSDLIQMADPQRIYLYQDAFKKACIELQKNFTLEPFKNLYLRPLDKPFFSERHFPKNSKVKQIHVAWENTIPWGPKDLAIFPDEIRKFLNTWVKLLQNKHELLHLEFTLPSFLKKLPGIIDFAKNYKIEEEIYIPI